MVVAVVGVDNLQVPWPSWESAVVVSLLSVLAMSAVRRRQPTKKTDVLAQSLREFALVAALYAIWQAARRLPFTHEDGAFDRARMIERFENTLHFPSEISMQHLIINHDWLARFINGYYAIVHVPAALIFLIWAFVRHRDRYPHWRNGLAAVTAGCLLIRFVRVAPPRFIEELGFVELSDRYGLGVYGPVGTGISDQFAAMPSIHVGWAAVVAFGTFALTKSRWRWLVLVHLPLTLFVVASTGHHWWLDGLVAVGILGIGLAVDTAVRQRGAKSAGERAPGKRDEEPFLELAGDETR